MPISRGVQARAGAAHHVDHALKMVHVYADDGVQPAHMYLDGYVTMSVHLCYEKRSGAGGRKPAHAADTLTGGPATVGEMAMLLPIWLGRCQALWEQRLDAIHTGVAPGETRTKELR
jgi:hypothetical protein